jgi:hypothetical protein
MQLRHFSSKITGVSIPIFGLSWTPPASEADAAVRVITFVEDRRVLMRGPVWSPYAVLSIVEIRKKLTDELEKLPRSSTLAQSLQAMRTACRIFLEQVESDSEHERFAEAISEFQPIMLVHIGRICAAYGIDLAPPLADHLNVVLHQHTEDSQLLETLLTT